MLLIALQHVFAGMKRTRDQKLSSRLMSGQLSLLLTFMTTHPFQWATAVQPSIRRYGIGPSSCQRSLFLVEPIGCWASTVARLQEARHLSFTWCCWQGGDYTTTTTAAPTPTPCSFVALPDADPTSCLGRVNHHRTKWVLPPQSENTALHGCVNRQFHHDSQHGTHRSMRMYQTLSQVQGVEAIVQPSATHSVMSVGLVERPIP